MKFARFYLRRKLEPCDSCCLCIGNLPTYLVDKGKYETILDEILKDSKSKIIFCWFNRRIFAKMAAEIPSLLNEK